MGDLVYLDIIYNKCDTPGKQNYIYHSKYEYQWVQACDWLHQIKEMFSTLQELSVEEKNSLGWLPAKTKGTLNEQMKMKSAFEL